MKRILSALAAAAIVAGTMSVAAFAYTVDGPLNFVSASPVDDDGDSVDGSYSTGMYQDSFLISGEDVPLGKELYFELDDVAGTGGTITPDQLLDSDLFNFKLDRDQNGKYLDKVKAVSRNLTGSRSEYIEVDLKRASITEEEKVTFNVYFKARKDDPNGAWSSGDIYDARFALWISNKYEDGDDATIETGSGAVFRPVDNEKNTVTWGDPEVASLEFTAADDADKFYAYLSTKINNSIYTDYGDPADADLYFRTFSGVKIDSTSRGTLTLYNPWSDYYDDNNYRVDPYNVYIYEVVDGALQDITSQFKYVDEDDTPAGIDGWETRLRTLGAYVISDTELDVDDYYDDGRDVEIIEPENSTAPKNPEPTPPKTPESQYIPSTGSGDRIVVIAVLGAASLGVMIGMKKRKRK